MTLSDVLGCEVVTAERTSLGHVIDVRLMTAGPDQPVQMLPFGALIVGRRHTGSLFGYERRREQRPAVLAWFFRWLHRDALLVSWSEVARWEPGQIVVLSPGATGELLLPS
ncbi:MAG: PRC-barrel domain containing protein [Actinomycetia bacterium]|nr:PRC-barrel domain containing protein [Actinomycetes bacterium]